MQGAQQFEVRFVAGTVFHRADIALELRVGVLPEHDNGDIRFLYERSVWTQVRCTSSRSHNGLDARIDGFAVWKILVGDARPLPGNRPAAALFADAVGTVAGDEYVLSRIQRQQMIVVLQQ